MAELLSNHTPPAFVRVLGNVVRQFPACGVLWDIVSLGLSAFISSLGFKSRLSMSGGKIWGAAACSLCTLGKINFAPSRAELMPQNRRPDQYKWCPDRCVCRHLQRSYEGQITVPEICRLRPSDRQDSAPGRWSLAYTSRGDQEGAHAPFRGVSCPRVRGPTPGYLAQSHAAMSCPGATPTAFSLGWGLGSAQARCYKEVLQPRSVVGGRAAVPVVSCQYWALNLWQPASQLLAGLPARASAFQSVGLLIDLVDKGVDVDGGGGTIIRSEERTCDANATSPLGMPRRIVRPYSLSVIFTPAAANSSLL